MTEVILPGEHGRITWELPNIVCGGITGLGFSRRHASHPVLTAACMPSSTRALKQDALLRTTPAISRWHCLSDLLSGLVGPDLLVSFRSFFRKSQTPEESPCVLEA